MAALIGRERERQALEAFCRRGARLITITGPPGIGKSRLARAYAVRREQTGTAAYLCNLGAARDRDEVVAAITAALDARLPAASEDAPESLSALLGGMGPIVLVLDNFEHLVAQAGAALGRWVEAAPDLHLVVSSREPLRVEGEHVVELGGLGLEEGIALFAERAFAAGYPGSIDGDQRKAIGAIVERLEGIPLAIELAAARMVLLTAEEILERLSNRLDILRGEGEGRHAALRDAIAWSWNLLTDWERDAAVQCTIFRGGFSPEAGEAILAVRAHAGAPASPLDAVEALRRRSLLQRTEDRIVGESRYALYECVREFIREVHLPEPSVEARHADYYLAAGETWAGASEGADAPAAFRRLAGEQGNLLSAAEHLEGARPEAAARLFLALDRAEGRAAPAGRRLDRLDRCVELCQRARAPALLVKALTARGLARRALGGMEEAREDFSRAIAAAEAAGLAAPESRRLHATLDYYQHRVAEARQSLDRALAEARQQGDERAAARVLNTQAAVLRRGGDSETPRTYLEAALAGHRRVGDLEFEHVALTNLGILAIDEERLDDAYQHLTQALALLRELGDQRREGTTLYALGLHHLLRGDLAQARGRLEESLGLHRQTGERLFEGDVLGYLGVAAQLQGEREEARRLYGEAVAYEAEVGDHATVAFFSGCRASLDTGKVPAEVTRRELARAKAKLAEEPSETLEAAFEVLEGLLDLEQGKEDIARNRLQSARGARRGDRVSLLLACRLLEERLGQSRAVAAPARRPATGGVLEVGPGGQWFRPPGGELVDLQRRPTLRRVLFTLAESQRQAPDHVVGVEALANGGWPGQNILPDAAASRVYVAINTLRKLGLRRLLLTREGGYGLDVPVEIVE